MNKKEQIAKRNYEALAISIEGLSKGQAISKSLANKDLLRESKVVQNVLNPEPNNLMKQALEAQGMTVDYITEKLKECMEAENVKIEVKSGTEIRMPDYKIRLQAIQIYLGICGYQGNSIPKEGDKHVHLHGKSAEELDDLLRAAQNRKD